MPIPTNTALADYLEGAIPQTAEAVTIVAAEPTATPAEVVQEIVNEVAPAPAPVVPPIPVVQYPDEEMKDLMAKVKRIGMCAKDLHYRAKGKAFYGLHQLADLAFQVEADTDSIAEVYFMGDRGIEPPRMDEVFKRAINLVVYYTRDDRYFISGLMDVCRMTMHSIEAIKTNFKDGIKSGVAAVLDKISEHCLLTIGLLDQTMKGA